MSSVFKFTVMKVPNILLLIDLFNLWLLRSGLFSLVNVIDLCLLSVYYFLFLFQPCQGDSIFSLFKELTVGIADPLYCMLALPPLCLSVPIYKKGHSNSMHSVCLLGGLFELIHARIVLGT